MVQLPPKGSLARSLPITVTDHARFRARERFPEDGKFDIVSEIRVALAAGRVSWQKPPGILNEPHPDCLYLWTEDGRRVYATVVDKLNPDGFAVKTTMRAELG